MESTAPARGEARWPMAAAVLAGLVLTMLRPAEVRVTPRPVLPAVELVLLGVLIARDPGRIDRRAAWLRGGSIAVVALLALDAVVATVHLVTVLTQGGHVTASAAALLTAGAVVWASNVVVFSLLYWELDSGGAAARAHRMPPGCRLRVSATAESRGRAPGLEAAVPRLPVPGPDLLHCLQPHGRHAVHPPGKGPDGMRVLDLAGRPGARHRARGQRPPVTRHGAGYGAITIVAPAKARGPTSVMSQRARLCPWSASDFSGFAQGQGRAHGAPLVAPRGG